MNAEYRGSWVRRGLVLVPDIPTEKPETVVWTETALRKAHAAHKRGLRDERTVAGHKEWDRRRKATERAGRLSAVDRQWAEKQAVIGSWVLDEQTNRSAIVASNHLER